MIKIKRLLSIKLRGVTAKKTATGILGKCQQFKTFCAQKKSLTFVSLKMYFLLKCAQLLLKAYFHYTTTLAPHNCQSMRDCSFRSLVLVGTAKYRMAQIRWFFATQLNPGLVTLILSQKIE